MGVLYVVWPLDDEIAPWLDELGVAYPSDLRGRPPTPREVRAGLAELVGFDLDENGPYDNGRWQVMVTASDDPDRGGWTLLNVLDYVDEDSPCRLGFEKGWPSLIAAIVHAVSAASGPLVLIPDTGEDPLVLRRDQALSELVASWAHAGGAAS